MELITIEQREMRAGNVVDTVSARELHSFLEVGRDFSAWIKYQCERAKLVSGTHFVTSEVTPQNGGVVRTEYHLTIDSAKHIAMLSGTDKGCEVRDYFIDCERRSKELHDYQLMDALNDPARMRLLLSNYVEKVLEQQALINEQAPKVAAFKLIAESSYGSLCITDAAKNLGMNRDKLILWLQEKNWIYRRMGTPWIAYQDRLKSGHLEHKVTTHAGSDGGERIASHVRVTARGMAFLGSVFAKVESVN